MHIVRRAALAVVGFAFVGTAALAQDAAKVDPRHYKVQFENDRVRVLRIHYGPHESSVMHSHPDSVVTYLTPAHTRFTLPNGKTIESSGKAGTTAFAPAGSHKPTNLSGQPMDAVLVELKGHGPAK